MKYAFIGTHCIYCHVIIIMYNNNNVFIGTHWMWEMLHMLLKGKPEYSRVPKERLMLSFSTQEFFDRLLPPRVFNTHAPFAGLPLTIRKAENRCKMIYLLRNPKDVAVSFYHHLRSQIDFQYEGTFHGFLELFLDGRGKFQTVRMAHTVALIVV